jgi:hypothetical protein
MQGVGDEKHFVRGHFAPLESVEAHLQMLTRLSRKLSAKLGPVIDQGSYPLTQMALRPSLGRILT